MHRRGFLGLLLGAVPLAVAGHNPPPTETFGYLTPAIVARLGYDNRTARVFLDGIDITEMHHLFGPILACDDRAGFIEVLARNDHGNYFSNRHGRLMRVRIYGDVRVTLQRPGAAA